MTLIFEDAQPVQTGGPGRTPDPNPYLDVMGSIALKTDSAGKPIAKAFVLDVDPKDGEVARKQTDRTLDKLRKAGKVHNVSVRTADAPVNDGKGKPVAGKVRITFWTIKRIVRPRKDA